MKLKTKISTIYEDAEDLAAFAERSEEPNLDFRDVLSDLESSKKISDFYERKLGHKYEKRRGA
jgi:hypothetical protein